MNVGWIGIVRMAARRGDTRSGKFRARCAVTIREGLQRTSDGSASSAWQRGAVSSFGKISRAVRSNNQGRLAMNFGWIGIGRVTARCADAQSVAFLAQCVVITMEGLQ
jgi:hypothetical protein